MHTKEIKKRSGGTRKVYIPTQKEKRSLREIVTTFPNPTERLQSAHGFIQGRNAVTNAMPHVINFAPGAIMLSFDIKNFFDNVTFSQVSSFFPADRKYELMQKCFPDGIAGQGLPTSPALANLAGIAIDEAIRRKIKKCWEGCVYTRYADDLSLSFPASHPPDPSVSTVISAIEEIVKRCGHTINKKKTRVQLATRGRWECCGVMIDQDGLHPTRRHKKLLRAAKHNFEQKKTRHRRNKMLGLLEWTKLKLPKTEEQKKEYYTKNFDKVETRQNNEANRIAKRLGIETLETYHKLKPDIFLEKDVVVTQDPVYFYGMSHFTTGWKTCMKTDKHYNRGSEIWRRLEGASIAYVKCNKMRYLYGVKRNLMNERALVFEAVDGSNWYSTIYPSKSLQGVSTLEHILLINGYKKMCRSAESNIEIKGSVGGSNHWPYIDKGKFLSLQGINVGYKFYV